MTPEMFGEFLATAAVLMVPVAYGCAAFGARQRLKKRRNDYAKYAQAIEAKGDIPLSYGTWLGTQPRPQSLQTKRLYKRLRLAQK